jgi:tyrosyl-tRNA synthetase
MKKSFNFYYGTAPTGSFHIGYLVPLGKTIDLIEAGGKATILIADYHAYLDDRKTPWEELEVRSEYYRRCIEAVLGEYKDKVRFVYGSEFQTKKEYVEDVFKLAGVTTFNRALRAASEVVRISDEPKVSSALYPIMQTVDVKYLEAEVALGGTDQRHIYMYSREVLPLIGWVKPICIFTPLITSLKGPGTKMSASIPGTHVKVHEKEEEVEKLIMNAYCPPKIIEKNPIVEIVRYILFPIFKKIKVERESKYGGDVEYENFEDLRKDYEEGKSHPYDLKRSVIRYLQIITSNVRKEFERDEELVEKIKKTYNWKEF